MFFPCLPVQVIQDKVKKNYNMDMWIRQCDRGILSCYIAQVTVISDLRNIVIKHGLICRDSMIFKNPCSEVVLETFSPTMKNARHSNRWRALLVYTSQMSSLFTFLQGGDDRRGEEVC